MDADEHGSDSSVCMGLFFQRANQETDYQANGSQKNRKHGPNERSTDVIHNEQTEDKQEEGDEAAAHSAS